MSEEIVDQEEVFEDEVEDETSEDTEDEQTEDTIDWKARAEKAEALIIKNKQKPKQQPIKKQDSEEDDIPDWGRKILSTEEKRSFGYDNNLSPETVDAVFQFTGGRTPSERDMEHPAVKAIVKSLEASKRVAANTPRGGTQPTYKGKTYQEIVTNKDATKADKQAAFEAVQRKYRK